MPDIKNFLEEFNNEIFEKMKKENKNMAEKLFKEKI